MRQVAIDAASIPKDAKIAALGTVFSLIYYFAIHWSLVHVCFTEKTSAESEKLIADARNDKMKQFEEMQTAQVLQLFLNSIDMFLFGF